MLPVKTKTAEIEARLNRTWARIDGRQDAAVTIDLDTELAWAVAACADCSSLDGPCQLHTPAK